MEIAIAKIYQTNHLYVPKYFLEETGMFATKKALVELDKENNRLIITPISAKEAEKAFEMMDYYDEQILLKRKTLKGLEEIDSLKGKKDEFLRNLIHK